MRTRSRRRGSARRPDAARGGVRHHQAAQFRPRLYQALKSFDVSVNQLGLDYLDLYLIHWPVPSKNLFVADMACAGPPEAGRACPVDRGIQLHAATPAACVGRNRGRAGAEPGRTASPVPAARIARLRRAAGIVTQSWSPLGRGHLPDIPAIRELLPSMARAGRKSCCAGILRRDWPSSRRS